MALVDPTSDIAHFIPPEDSTFPGALGRFLSPMPANVMEAYISSYTAPGDVVLDPFAHTDSLARSAANLGRRAILSDLNPLTAFVARTTLLPVTGHEIQLAVTRIAAGKQAEETLSAHLDGLYATYCPHCGAQAVASEFLWERRVNGPVAKRCLCTACAGERGREPRVGPVTAEDLDRLRAIEPRGFHYWFLTDRLARGGEEHAELAEQMLALYTPRNAYALATLLRHIEGSGLGPNMQSVLKLALLDCLCACSRLEPEHPADGSTTEIDLKPPSHYRERNVWRWFTDACRTLQRRFELRGAEASPPRLAASVERLLAPSEYSRLGNPPNTVVLDKAARALHKHVPADAVSLVLAAPPGPAHGQFLCLSYLWTGWLFGAEHVKAIEQIPCSRRPMDWGAYYRALGGALRGFGPSLREGAAVVFLVEASSHRQCEAIVLSGVAAGLELRRVLCQPKERKEAANPEKATRYQVEFRKPPRGQIRSFVAAAGRAVAVETAVRRETEQAVRDVLALRAEPTPSVWLRAGVLEHLGRTGLLFDLLAAREFDGLAVAELVARETEDALERAKRRRVVVAVVAPDKTWELARPPHDAPALGDRVEWAVYNLLSTSRATTIQNAQRVIYGLFPGHATPDAGWVEECVCAYARQRPDGTWALREEDRLATRLDQHTALVSTLVALGRRFGYRIWVGREEQKRPLAGRRLGDLLDKFERFASPATLFGGPQAADVDVIWYDEGLSLWLFEVEWTAMLHLPVIGRRLPAKGRRFLVVADERAPLIKSRLRRAPWLAHHIRLDGWHFVKYSQLLSFAAATDCTPQALGSIVGLETESVSTQGQLDLS